MHEVSLGGTIRDYLTDKDIENTTYEDLRQALAKLLVEEKGFPKNSIVPKYEIRFPIDNDTYVRRVDLAVFNEAGEPVFILIFCPGKVDTYVRETVTAARLMSPVAAPLAAVTDSMDARLMESFSGEILDRGFEAIPGFDRLQTLLTKHPRPVLSEERTQKERRILYMYSEFSSGACCGRSCTIKGLG